MNVHPRKEEVKFMHPRIVEQTITHAVVAALEAHTSDQMDQIIKPAPVAAHIPPSTSAQPTSFVPFDFGSLAQTSSHPYTQEKSLPRNTAEATASPPSGHAAPTHNPMPLPTMPTPPSAATVIEEATVNQTVHADEQSKLIGQFHNTYILAHTDEGLLFVDQHAAHERILYEKFGDTFTDIPTISLIFPQTISLSSTQLAALEPHFDLLKNNGIIAEQFGQTSLIIRATPVHLKDIPIANLIQEAVGWIQEYEHLDEAAFTKTLHEKLRAQMACKAAIKAGDTLTDSTMRELLQTLSQTKNRFSCPHGRPTSWILTLDHIEKQFRRKF